MENILKKLFISVAGLFLFSPLLISCSNFNVFRDITFGSDMENIENILSQNGIKYKTYPAAPFIDSIDLENPEEIAEHIVKNSATGFLGDMLYKESVFYKQNINGPTFETLIYFFKGKCTNIYLTWYLKNNLSLRNGFLASEKLMTYINQQYPDLKFEPAETELGGKKYIMQLSDTVSITIQANEESLYCDMEDAVLQKPYKELKEQVDALVKDYKGKK